MELIEPRAVHPALIDAVAVAGVALAGSIALAPVLVLLAVFTGRSVTVAVWGLWLMLGVICCARWPSNVLARAIGSRTPRPEDELVVLRHALVRACIPAGVDPESIILRVALGKINAYSSGRDVVALTEDLLSGDRAVEATQIEALIAHELGHHRHGDTLLGGAVWWYRAPLVAIHRVGRMLGRIPLVGTLLETSITMLLLAVLWPVHVAWHVASIPREFLADRFAVDCGYGIPLERFFTGLARYESYWSSGLLTVFAASHPPMADRIARIQDAFVDEADTYIIGEEKPR